MVKLATLLLLVAIIGHTVHNVQSRYAAHFDQSIISINLMPVSQCQVSIGCYSSVPIGRLQFESNSSHKDIHYVLHKDIHVNLIFLHVLLNFTKITNCIWFVMCALLEPISSRHIVVEIARCGCYGIKHVQGLHCIDMMCGLGNAIHS